MFKNRFLKLKSLLFGSNFYSPIIKPKDLLNRENEIWCENPKITGIDFNEEFQYKVLTEYFPKFINNYTYVEKFEETNSDIEFYTQNSQFSWLDSRSLFVLLNQWKPNKILEVGSGFSSLLTASINKDFLNNSVDFRCIEPFPRKFLHNKIEGLNDVIIDKVENLPLSLFENLESGDVLFIDSSHVAKTGSDVNYLIFEVLPVLKKGVRIHFHDIFLPHEYPKDWVMKYYRSWNEQYLLRALLMYSDTFQILFGSSYAYSKFPELVVKALNLPNKLGFAGSSFWIEKIN